LEDAGVSLLRELMPRALRVNELLAEGLEPEEAAQLDSLLDKLLASPAVGANTGD
jgi:DNA-binding MarR family transcriptional regulator